MISAPLAFRRSKADNSVDHLGVVTNYAADAALGNTTYVSNWIDLGSSMQSVPSEGLELYINLAASSVGSTGAAAGSATLAAKLDFGDDGAAGISSQTSQSVTFTFAAANASATALTAVKNGVTTTYNLPTVMKMNVPVAPHRYVRLTLTTTMTTVTAVAYGLAGAWLDVPVAGNMTGYADIT